MDDSARRILYAERKSFYRDGRMDRYLESSEYIDWRNPGVLSQARALARGLETPEAVARACFEFVRDEIKHSLDHRLNPVTARASEVLTHGTGYCYAKSHLLAALLRANGIPAGLCYQRLTIDGDVPPFCLHGLNAVRLPGCGWYRLDARGNRADISAQFTPPIESLAFTVATPGEADLPEIWAEPLPLVTAVLSACRTYEEVLARLPDIELLRF